MKYFGDNYRKRDTKVNERKDVTGIGFTNRFLLWQYRNESCDI